MVVVSAEACTATGVRIYREQPGGPGRHFTEQTSHRWNSNLRGEANVSPFLGGYQMKTEHPSVWMLGSVMENETSRGAGRRPAQRRSKTRRVIKCHSMTKAGVNYEIKLSKDFVRPPKGCDCRWPPQTPQITHSSYLRGYREMFSSVADQWTISRSICLSELNYVFIYRFIYIWRN